MAATSKLNEAEDALKALLAATAAIAGNPLAGVRIDLGDPGSGLLAEDVWIAEDVPEEQTSDLTGLGAENVRRREKFTLKVNCFGSRSGGDFVPLRTRVSAMAEEVELVVRDNPTLSDTVWFAEVAGFDRSGGATDNGRVLMVTLKIDVVAYPA